MQKTLLFMTFVLFTWATLSAQIVVHEEHFDDTLGTWTEYSVLGDQVWYPDGFGDRTYAYMSGYSGGAVDNEDWLISPELDLTNYIGPYFEFVNTCNYSGPDLELKVSTDYDGTSDPSTSGTWTDLTSDAAWSSGGWTWVNAFVDLSDYNEAGVYLAFVYTSSTNSGAKAWEIDSAYVRAEGIIPVELTSFNAVSGQDEILLKWSTASETNNQGFEVQRSTDETNWSKLAFVEGNGTVNSTSNYSYTDKKVSDTETYFYRLKQVDMDGTFEYSSVVEVDAQTPTEFKLSQNYPNPFNPSTTIEFALPQASNVDLTVYNSIGEEVVNLVNQNMEAGFHTVNFNASELNSGIYVYRLQAGDFISIRKMILMK